MAVFEWLFAALLFVATSGFLFSERFRKNKFLVLLVIILTLTSTYVLLDDVRHRVERFITRRVELALITRKSDQPQIAPVLPSRPASMVVPPLT
jgi:hypothetical protein